jgi:hypothetical protein
VLKQQISHQIDRLCDKFDSLQPEDPRRNTIVGYISLAERRVSGRRLAEWAGLVVQRYWPCRLGASEASAYSEPEESMHSLLKAIEAHAALTQAIAAVGSVTIAVPALIYAVSPPLGPNLGAGAPRPRTRTGY